MHAYDLIVIGSGPAGKTCAIQAAKLGKRVAIIEGFSKLGGVCVHTGTIPSKTLRETVLNLTGWRERGFYGRAYRVKSDIKAEDLTERLTKTLQNEVDILEDQLTRNNVEFIQGWATFLSPSEIEVCDQRDERHVMKADKFMVAVGTRTYLVQSGNDTVDSPSDHGSWRSVQDIVCVATSPAERCGHAAC